MGSVVNLVRGFLVVEEIPEQGVASVNPSSPKYTFKQHILFP